jgi:hypothetical protein
MTPETHSCSNQYKRTEIIQACYRCRNLHKPSTPLASVCPVQRDNSNHHQSPLGRGHYWTSGLGDKTGGTRRRHLKTLSGAVALTQRSCVNVSARRTRRACALVTEDRYPLSLTQAQAGTLAALGADVGALAGLQQARARTWSSWQRCRA